MPNNAHILDLRQSHYPGLSGFSGFWRLRCQISSRHRVREIISFVAPVAERLIRGMPAPAQRDRRPSPHAECIPFLVHHLEVTLHSNWSIIENRYFSSRQLPSLIRFLPIVHTMGRETLSPYHPRNQIQNAALFGSLLLAEAVGPRGQTATS